MKTVEMHMGGKSTAQDDYRACFLHQEGGLCVSCPDCGYLTRQEDFKSGDIYTCPDCHRQNRLIF